VVIEPQKAVAGAPRVLIAEFLLCIVIVAAKPFEKTGEDAKISEGTIGQFAAIMVLFFILALFGGVSAKTQKAANLFGALVTLGLLFKNTETIATVASAVAGASKTPAAPGPGGGTAAPVPVPGGNIQPAGTAPAA
jgi:prepilin signal peptidase PulO-like enzyme (type II secretory pathway)